MSRYLAGMGACLLCCESSAFALPTWYYFSRQQSLAASSRSYREGRVVQVLRHDKHPFAYRRLQTNEHEYPARTRRSVAANMLTRHASLCAPLERPNALRMTCKHENHHPMTHFRGAGRTDEHRKSVILVSQDLSCNRCGHNRTHLSCSNPGLAVHYPAPRATCVHVAVQALLS